MVVVIQAAGVVGVVVGFFKAISQVALTREHVYQVAVFCPLQEAEVFAKLQDLGFMFFAQVHFIQGDTRNFGVVARPCDGTTIGYKVARGQVGNHGFVNTNGIDTIHTRHVDNAGGRLHRQRVGANHGGKEGVDAPAQFNNDALDAAFTIDTDRHVVITDERFFTSVIGLTISLQVIDEYSPLGRLRFGPVGVVLNIVSRQAIQNHLLNVTIGGVWIVQYFIHRSRRGCACSTHHGTLLGKRVVHVYGQTDHCHQHQNNQCYQWEALTTCHVFQHVPVHNFLLTETIR